MRDGITRCGLAALTLALFVLGCAEDEPAPGGGGGGGGIAVLGSDYMSTVVSLVDAASGQVVRDRCLDSGSKAPQLSAALSGDVTLPSGPQAGHELVLIDRQNGTLTWLDPVRCQVLRQMNVGDGFSANPQDLVAGPPGKAYVTRYDRNPGRPGEGSDLLVIDPARAVALRTIALPAPAPGEVGGGKMVSPRPARALRIGDKLYVALNNLSDDFEAGGPGRVAVVDTTSDTVAGTIDLPGLKNCGALVRVQDAAGRPALVVGCDGLYSDGPGQIDAAGFAWVDLEPAPAVKVVPARMFERRASGSVLAVAGPDRAFTVLPGDRMGPAVDAVWTFDFRGGLPRKLVEGSGAFVLSLALSPDSGRLYVLDAADKEPHVSVYALAPDGKTEMASRFVASPETGLPPRVLGFY